MINHAAVAGEIAQRHFHQHHDFFALHSRFLHELRLGAIQHVDGDFRHGPKTAALDEDRFFVKYFGGLHHFAVGREHGRISQPLRHQLQTHQAILHFGERRPGELDRVHFDAVAIQVVH